MRCCWRLRRDPGAACAGAGWLVDAVAVPADAVVVPEVVLDCALAVSAKTNPAAATVSIRVPFKVDMSAPLSFSPASRLARVAPVVSPPAIPSGDRTVLGTQVQTESFGAVTRQSVHCVDCKSFKSCELVREMHSTCPRVTGDSERIASWNSPRLPLGRMRASTKCDRPDGFIRPACQRSRKSERARVSQPAAFTLPRGPERADVLPPFRRSKLLPPDPRPCRTPSDSCGTCRTSSRRCGHRADRPHPRQ